MRQFIRGFLVITCMGSLLMACTPEGFIAFNDAILDAAQKNGIDLTIESEATFKESTKTTFFGETTEEEKVEKVSYKGSVKKQTEIVEEIEEVEETVEEVEEIEEESLQKSQVKVGGTDI